MLPFSSTAKLSKTGYRRKSDFPFKCRRINCGASLEGAGLCALNPARQERERL